MEKKPWNTEKILSAASEAVRKNSLSLLEQVLDGMDSPAEMEISLAEITQKRWLEVKQVHGEAWKERMKQERARKRRQATSIVVGAVVFTMSVLVAYFGYPFIVQPPVNTPTSTNTITPTLSLTSTVSPTIAETPTLTPEPILQPVDENDATDPLAILPAVPIAPEKAWLLQPNAAVAEPGMDTADVWTKETDPATQVEYAYSKTGSVSLAWEKSFNPGYYAVYALDYEANSGGAGLDVPLIVSIEGAEVAPITGSNQIHFSDDAAEPATKWALAGIYRLTNTSLVGFVMKLNEVSAEQPFAAPMLLVERLGENEKLILDTFDSTTDRPAVCWLDNEGSTTSLGYSGSIKTTKDGEGSIIGFSYSGMIMGNLKNPEPINSIGWAGSMGILGGDLLVKNPLIQVQWQPPCALPAGKYEILVWIPNQHFTAKVQYNLAIKNKDETLEKLVPDGSAGWLDQSLYPTDKTGMGEWRSVGMWTLNADGDITVIAETTKVYAEETTEFGWDLMVVVKAE